MKDDPNAAQWEYFLDCIRESPPVAEFSRIRDSQTDRLLTETFRLHRAPTIIDYGCGALRHLFALLNLHGEREWSYIGVDVRPVAEMHPEALRACEQFAQHRNRWKLLTIKEFCASTLRADVAYLVNVVHELPLRTLADAFEDIRRHLGPTGHLLVMDTGFLPEGEPRFVPLVESDVPVLLNAANDLSYRSRKGIPIVFASARRNQIPDYQGTTDKLRRWMEDKRNVLAFLGASGGAAESNGFLSSYGLSRTAVFNFLYLNTIVANATYRLVELDLTHSVSEQEFSTAGREIINFLADALVKRKVSIADVYDELGGELRYVAIEAALAEFARPQIPSILMAGPFIRHRELEASEAFDLLMDNSGKYGLFGDRPLVEILIELYEDWHEWHSM
jgi:SAM-dependent methyltransferase